VITSQMIGYILLVYLWSWCECCRREWPAEPAEQHEPTAVDAVAR